MTNKHNKKSKSILSKNIKKKPKSIKTNKKIKTQLLSMITLILLVAISSVAAINFYYQNQRTLEQAKLDNINIAMSVANQVDLFVNNSKNTIKTAVNSVSFDGLDQTAKNIILTKILSTNMQFKSLYILDMEGREVATTDGKVNPGANFSEEQWFIDAAMGMTHVTDSYIDEDNLPTLILSQPLETLTDGRTGVIYGKLRLDKLHSFIQGIQIGNTGHIYIVDKKGTTIAHRNFQEKVLGGYNAIENNIDGVKMVLENGQGSGVYLDDASEKVVGGFENVPSVKWGVVAEQQYDDIIAQSLNAFKIMLIASIFFVVLGIIYGIYWSKKFTKPISNMVNITNRIKDGDLTQILDLDSNNELGILQMSLNDMVKSLKMLIVNINNTSNDLNDSSKQLQETARINDEASSQISKVIEEVASSTQEQIKGVNETSSTIEQMSDSLKSATENSMEIHKSSTHASELAETGANSIENIVETMDEIDKTVNESSKLILKLNDDINKIDGIVKFINGISEQTNLLALNASIEAARAGEHGLGFTVVANEVKKLADQSKSASKEIVGLINKIQKDSSEIVKSMDKSIVEVREGSNVINDTTKSFKAIIEETHNVANQVQDFVASMQQLSAGTDIVEGAFQQVIEQSNTTATGAENVLASVQEQEAATHHISELIETLNIMAVELEGVVKRFKV